MTLYYKHKQPPNPKQLKQYIKKQHYQPPDEKQFIAYSLILKESKSGMSSNERLLLFDSKQKSLRYYSKIPEPLPTVGQLGQGKEIIFKEKVKKFTFKSTRTGIGKALVQWSDENSVKQEWYITFGSNHVLNQWVLLVNEALKDGHHRPENRPKSKIRQSKISPEKYQTQFMKETPEDPNRSRDLSLFRKAFWEKSKIKEEQQPKEERENSAWLTRYIMAKQENMNNQHQDRISETEPVEKDMKASKKGIDSLQKYQEEKSESNLRKKLDENMMNNFILHESPIKKEGSTNKVENQMTEQKRRIQQEEQKYRKELERIQMEKQRLKKQEAQRKKQRQREQALENQRRQKQFSLKVKSIAEEKMKKQSRKLDYESKRSNHPWINMGESFFYRYEKFVKQSVKYCEVFIEKLPEIVEQISRSTFKPSYKLFFQDENLQIQKNQIHFAIPLIPSSSSYSISKQTLLQYSNLTKYVENLSERHSFYEKIQPLPFCIVEYKGYKIKCTSTIPSNWERASQPQKIDEYFSVKSREWAYYEMGGFLIVDFGQLKTEESINPLEIQQFLNSLEQQQYMLTCLEDIESQFLLRHNRVITEATLITLTKLWKGSRWYSDFFSHCLCGVMISVELQNQLLKLVRKMGTDNGFLIESLYKSLNDYLDENNFKHKQIWRQINKLGVPTYEELMPGVIVSTIFRVLHLLVEYNGYGNLGRQELRFQGLKVKFSSHPEFMYPHNYEQSIYELKNILISTPTPDSHETLMDINRKFEGCILFEIPYHHRIKMYEHLYTPYTNTSLQLPEPPNYHTLANTINCLKWLIKKNQHSTVKGIFQSQMQICQFWLGQLCPCLLRLWELCSLYFLSVFDIQRAVDFGEKAAVGTMKLYGENFPQSIEKLYQLGNIYTEGEMIQEALDTYQQALRLMNQRETTTAELMIRRRVCALLLMMGNTEECLEECLYCLKIDQEQEDQLFVLSHIIKCYEILGNSQKLLQLIDITSNRFNDTTDAQIRQQYLRVCLYPLLRIRITDERRRSFLARLVQHLQKSYQGRYKSQQYLNYLHKLSQENLISLLCKVFVNVPIYYSSRKNVFEDLYYSLYGSFEHEEEEICELVEVMKLVESVCGVVGYGYLLSCFVDQY